MSIRPTSETKIYSCPHEDLNLGYNLIADLPQGYVLSGLDDKGLIVEEI